MENFLGKAEDHHLISDSLASDIRYFIANANMLIVTESIHDENFLEMQYLATKIKMGLDNAYREVQKRDDGIGDNRGGIKQGG